MLLVVLAFAVVFLFRDVQVLVTDDRKTLGWRFAGYAALILVAVAIASGFGEARPAILYTWTERRFALAAILIQLAELAVALALRRQWIGRVLPCPAFLLMLFVLSYTTHTTIVGLTLIAATELVTACWLTLVAVCAISLDRIENKRSLERTMERKFVNDFALMTSCTAFIFVPYGLF